ncbi:MAG: hypothetical protein QOD65_721 [Gaiellales bacterium]|nr:hypothetical protein [Gaiellales bacterium]
MGPQARETGTARRLSELRRAGAADPTLQNLLNALGTKLDTCARLPVFEYEAASEGHESPAAVFRRLAEVERGIFDELVVCLRRHLDDTLSPLPSEPVVAGHESER